MVKVEGVLPEDDEGKVLGQALIDTLENARWKRKAGSEDCFNAISNFLVHYAMSIDSDPRLVISIVAKAANKGVAFNLAARTMN